MDPSFEHQCKGSIVFYLHSKYSFFGLFHHQKVPRDSYIILRNLALFQKMYKLQTCSREPKDGCSFPKGCCATWIMVEMCHNQIFLHRKNIGKVFQIFSYDKFLLLAFSIAHCKIDNTSILVCIHLYYGCNNDLVRLSISKYNLGIQVVDNKIV